MISNAMIVDDELIDQRLYRRVLEKSGVVDNVITFSYADEALDFFRQSPDTKVDVIFLDINMPRMSGFEFLDAATAEFGQKFADAVIIMLTTSIDPTDRKRAADYSVVRDFINKPLTIEDVRRAAALLRGEVRTA